MTIPRPERASRPEALESRIAPASVFTFTDVDGDRVTISSSVGDLDAAGVIVKIAAGVGEQIQTLKLTDASFQGASITTTVVKAPGGDGLVDVGFIDATGRDLTSVKIRGDLGRIAVGDSDTRTPALALLSVRSMGLYGTATQAGSGSLASEIEGPLGIFKVKGDLRGAFVSISANAPEDGRIDRVMIGRSLVGGDATNSGRILASGSIGSITIGADVVGGTGAVSGSLEAASIEVVSVDGSIYGNAGNGAGSIGAVLKIGSVTIGSDVLGGVGTGSGNVQAFSGEMGDVTVGGSMIGNVGTASGSIYGKIGVGAVRIMGNVIGATGAQSGQIGAGGPIASVVIGKSLKGGFNDFSGSIVSEGTIGKVRIGADLIGNAGMESGRISAGSSIASVTIGGSVRGHSETGTGEIHSAGDLGPVRIGGDLTGGTAATSGRIFSGGSLASVTIGGAVLGGTGSMTGEIFSTGPLGPVKIAGDLIGGSLAATLPNLNRTGYIEGSSIESIVIGGSIVTGSDRSTPGDLLRNGSIRATFDIGPIKVRGSLIGHTGATGDTPVIITANGQETLGTGASTDLAIESLFVAGRVEHSRILAGYNTNQVGMNGNASIGAVRVGGDWIASDLVAGVKDNGTAAVDDGFGDVDDEVINNGTDAIIAQIASVLIKGMVVGTGDVGDHYGFVAQQIGSFRSQGLLQTLTAAKDEPIELSRPTQDVTVREV